MNVLRDGRGPSGEIAVDTELAPDRRMVVNADCLNNDVAESSLDGIVKGRVEEPPEGGMLEGKELFHGR